MNAGHDQNTRSDHEHHPALEHRSWQSCNEKRTEKTGSVQFVSGRLMECCDTTLLSCLSCLATQRTDCGSRNQGTAPRMETDMGVEAKGFSAKQNEAAVWGVSGVLGSLIDHKHLSQLLRCYALMESGTPGFDRRDSTSESVLPVGVSRRQAIRHGKSRKDYWHMAKTIASGVGMTNAWLQEQGLVSLKSLRASLAPLR